MAGGCLLVILQISIFQELVDNFQNQTTIGDPAVLIGDFFRIESGCSAEIQRERQRERSDHNDDMYIFIYIYIYIFVDIQLIYNFIFTSLFYAYLQCPQGPTILPLRGLQQQLLERPSKVLLRPPGTPLRRRWRRREPSPTGCFLIN